MVALGPHDAGHVSLAQQRRRFGECVEYEPQIERGAADRLEHVSRCSLLLQRLAQFVEQPRILNRDDGLVGESRH
jgi:hypothetical protein